MISITSANIQCHINIFISTEYVQYTEVSVKKFGFKKLKGTNNNILNILSLLYPPQTKFGGYIGITLSVSPSMYLVSATPPKLLIEFLGNFTQL